MQAKGGKGQQGDVEQEVVAEAPKAELLAGTPPGKISHNIPLSLAQRLQANNVNNTGKLSCCSRMMQALITLVYHA